MPRLGYAPVPQTPAKEHWNSSDDTLDAHASAPTPYQRPSRLVNYLFTTAYIVCVISSLYTIVTMVRALQRMESPLDISTLERPSVYIDLERAATKRPLANSSSTLQNLPYVVAQASFSMPGKAFPKDDHRWLTPFGTVTPDESDVLITPDMSTVLQTRGQDYGMELCTVVADFPDEAGVRARAANNKVELLGDTSEVEVWLMDAPREYDARLVTRSTLPSRGTTLGTLDVKLGSKSSTPQFPCSARSLITIELACPKTSCLVRFTMDKDKPLMGFYVEQHSSL